MRHPKERIWVHPEFKKKLKEECARDNLPLLEFTRKIAADGKSLEEIFRKKREVPRFHL